MSAAALWKNNENVVQVSMLMTSDQHVIIKQVYKICISYTLVQGILIQPE